MFEDGYPNRPTHRVTLGDVLYRLLDRMEAVYDVLPAVGVRGSLIPTGIVELDVVLGSGVAVGEVVVIAADSPLQRRALTATSRERSGQCGGRSGYSHPPKCVQPP